MQKISTEATPLAKAATTFPFIIAAGMVVMVFVMQAISGKPALQGATILMLTFIIGIALLFVVTFKRNAPTLEEVFVSEDALIVRRNNEEDIIPFADIESMKHAGGLSTQSASGNVHYHTMLFRITLKTERKFGKSMTFRVAPELANNPSALLELANKMEL
jgi:hypothetical protein